MGNRMSYKYLLGLIVFGLFLSQTVNAAGPASVNLGSAGSFAILTKTGISTTGTTSIVGDIGVSPISSTAITGFGLIIDSSGTFATSSLVTGKVYAADYSAPTPTKMTTAISDMQTAYSDAAGRTNPTATELGAGNIDGMTLTPGLYKWGTGVTIPTGVTLDCQGNANSVFIFQIAQNLNVGNGAIIHLIGGCVSQNIFWQVAGQATLGTTSNFQGIILSQTAIIVSTGATVNGRLLAQTAVTLDADAVTAPTGSGSVTTATTTTPTTTIGGLTTTPTTTIGGGGTSTIATTIESTIPTTSISGSTTTPTTSIAGSTTTPTTSIGGGGVVVTTYQNAFGQTVTRSYNPATGAVTIQTTGTAIPTTTIGNGGLLPPTGSNDAALYTAVALIAILVIGAGLYYYSKVMKKRK
jgi:hypothetical protein